MKKASFIFWVGLLAAGLLVLVGCPTSSEGNGGESSGKGVLGQVSGVVYDSVTAQPVKGVTVELGTVAVTSDNNGQYLFKDVKPGTYTVSYKKDGYQFASKNVVVDPGLYKTDDPFLEYHSLMEQLTALNEWVKRQGIPAYNGAAGAVTWTYQDGVWVTGDGTKVQVINENDQFVVKEVKMNYTYSKGIPLYLTRLVPLSGAIQGKIKLVKTVYNDRLNVKLEEAVPIDVGIELWLIDTATNIGYSDGANTAAVAATPRYGPVKTEAGGAFKISGVPVNTNLSVVTNGFTQADYYFKATAQAYSYDYSTNVFANASILSQNGGGTNPPIYTDIGDIYLFTEGTFAIVTAAEAGSPVAALNPTDAITVTFNKAIDSATFSAFVQTDATTNAVNVPDNTSITLGTSWSADNKTVTLKPSARAGTLLSAILPYSTDGSKAVGRLHLSGKAADGANIYADGTTDNANGIPVYTAEGLKLLNIDINPTGIPNSRVAVSATAIKLSFSKPLSTTSRFGLGALTNNVDYTLSTDKKDVFVWTDTLSSTGRALYYSAVSASDPADTVVADTGTNGFTKAPAEQPLALVSTNIYENRTNSGPITAAGANFPLDGTIMLTFSRNIPSSAKVRAMLVSSTIPTDWDKSISLSTTFSNSNKTLNITPTLSLKFGTTYYLALEITNGSETLFTTTSVNTYNVYNGSIVIMSNNSWLVPFYSISFQTMPDPNVSVRVSGNNSSTSATWTTVNNTGITGGTVTLGTEYFVQFDGSLSFSANTNASNTTAAGPYVASANAPNNNVLRFVFRQIGPDILGITVQLVTGQTITGTSATNVSLAAGIKGAGGTSGRINTSTGNFTISGLTVNP